VKDHFANLMTNMDKYASEEFREFDKWSMPIPSPAQYYPRDGPMAIPSILSVDQIFIGLGADLENAKNAIANEMDTVIAAMPRGLVDVNSAHKLVVNGSFPNNYDEMQIENIGISPFDPALSVVSKELALVNLKYNQSPLIVDTKGVDLSNNIVEEIMYWNLQAKRILARNALWFGGAPSSNWEDSVPCTNDWQTDTGSGDDFYCRVGVTGTALNNEFLKRAYREEWEGINPMSRPSVVKMDIDVPDLSSLKGKNEITGWATGVGDWIDSLYGGREETMKKPKDRTTFCRSGTAAEYLDICVLRMDFSSGKKEPVAGRCALDKQILKSFDAEKHCAKWASDDVIDRDTQFVCISPMRTTRDSDGDVHNATDIDVTNPGAAPSMMTWSGLVPGLLHLGGGRTGRFVGPTCPLFCSDEILEGKDNFGIDDDEDNMDKLWFGTPSFYGETKPLLTAFQTPTFTNTAGTKVSPIRFLKDYRSCLLND